MKKVIFILLLSLINLNAGDLEKGIEAIKSGNDTKGIKYLKKSCNSGEGKGCYLLALYFDNDKINKDKKLAHDFFVKACNLDYKDGCYLINFTKFFSKNDKEDYKKAKLLFEKDCANGDGVACSRLSMMYIFGQGVDRDLSNGKGYVKKACDLGDEPSCKTYQKLKNVTHFDGEW